MIGQRTPNGPELVSTPDGIGKAQIDGQIFRDMLISLLDLFARSCSFFSEWIDLALPSNKQQKGG